MLTGLGKSCCASIFEKNLFCKLRAVVKNMLFPFPVSKFISKLFHDPKIKRGAVFVQNCCSEYAYKMYAKGHNTLFSIGKLERKSIEFDRYNQNGTSYKKYKTTASYISKQNLNYDING